MLIPFAVVKGKISPPAENSAGLYGIGPGQSRFGGKVASGSDLSNETVQLSIDKQVLLCFMPAQAGVPADEAQAYQAISKE
jgi:hypothetical protein